MKKKKTITKLIQHLSLIIIGGVTIWLSPAFNHPLFTSNSQERSFQGTIQSINETQTEEGKIQDIKIKLTSPPKKGEIINTKNETDKFIQKRDFKKGERVILNELIDQNNETIYILQGHERYTGIYLLLVIFIIAVLLINSWQGAGSIIGLAISFLVIFKFILPQILTGASPITTVILGTFIIIPANFILSHGINRKTILAMIGTFITLIFSGLLAIFFAKLTHLTGMATEETSFLKLSTQSTIDFKGLVLSGILISILGILDDITIAQCSIMQQLKNAKESISSKELFSRGMKVGRDHISSMVNTLILVFAGASLPTLLLFMDSASTFNSVLNIEFIAEEILQTLIGSIGLIFAVPITTFLAAIFLKKNKEKKQIPVK